MKRRAVLYAGIAIALAAPATAMAQGRPDYCRPGWARGDSGLSDQQRQTCARPAPPVAEPRCEGSADACQRLTRQRRAEAAELGAETEIMTKASPRLREYFHTMDDITDRLVAASRANRCGLRSDQWYNNLVNAVWLLGMQERRRLGLSASEDETANRLTDLRFKRLGQASCGGITAATLRQLDSFADEMEHAYR